MTLDEKIEKARQKLLRQIGAQLIAHVADNEISYYDIANTLDIDEYKVRDIFNSLVEADYISAATLSDIVKIAVALNLNITFTLTPNQEQT